MTQQKVNRITKDGIKEGRNKRQVCCYPKEVRKEKIKTMSETIFIYPDIATLFDAVKEGDILRHKKTGDCYEIIFHRGVSIEAKKVEKSATLSEFDVIKNQ